MKKYLTKIKRLLALNIIDTCVIIAMCFMLSLVLYTQACTRKSVSVVENVAGGVENLASEEVGNPNAEPVSILPVIISPELDAVNLKIIEHDVLSKPIIGIEEKTFLEMIPECVSESCDGDSDLELGVEDVEESVIIDGSEEEND